MEATCTEVVIFQDGQKIMQLEGVDAAAASVEDLQEALEDVAGPSASAG